MEELIVSISQEPTDEARRQRMSTLFAEALKEHHSERFTSLFDQVLIIVGDRVQVLAQQEALKDDITAERSSEAAPAAATRERESRENTASGGGADQDFMTGKSAEQKQLWALVDMMVQSKIIVKRANEDLAKKETPFQ